MEEKREIEVDKNLEGMTLNEVLTHVALLIDEHGGDTRLKIIWNSEQFKINLVKDE